MPEEWYVMTIRGSHSCGNTCLHEDEAICKNLKTMKVEMFDMLWDSEW